jgi:ABC-type metal ion transport system substrate-binding protein
MYQTVKDIKGGASIKPGDVIKFGRVPFLIKEAKIIVVSSESSSYEEGSETITETQQS